MLRPRPSGPYGLPRHWLVRADRTSRFHVIVGPGGVFLVGSGISRRLDQELADAAAVLERRLTARIDQVVHVQTVRTLTRTQPQPLHPDGPMAVVNESLLAEWLQMHHRIFEDRQVRILAHVAGASLDVT